MVALAPNNPTDAGTTQFIRVTGSFLHKDFGVTLPKLEGVTAPSWYTGIQIQSLEHLIRCGIAIKGRTIADLGAGSMLTGILLAQQGAYVYCYEPCIDYYEYVRRLGQIHSNACWWRRLIPINGCQDDLCTSPTATTVDIFLSNMPTAAFPVNPGELQEVQKRFGSSVKPSFFSDGGFYGCELMYAFINRISANVRKGVYFVIQLPEFCRRPGESVIARTLAVLERAGIRIEGVHEYSYTIRPNSIIHTRLSIYLDRLNWKPELHNGVPKVKVFSFIGQTT